MNRYVSTNESYPAIFDIAKKEMKPLPMPAEGKFRSARWSLPRMAIGLCHLRRQGEFLQLAGSI